MERNTDTLYILRFLAAVMVVWYHYSPLAVGNQMLFVIKNGFEAVNFFFFISGFVMVLSSARFFAGNEGNFPYKPFYLKRFARIYPLYLLAILLLLAFHFGVKRIDTPTVIYRMPFEMAGVQRWLYGGSFNYPGWSVSCEFMFYLLFPLLAAYLRGKTKLFTGYAWGYFFLSLAATVFISGFLETAHPNWQMKLSYALLFNPILLISIFILGMLAGKCFLDNKHTLFKHTWLNVLLTIASAAIIITVKYAMPNNAGLLRGGMLAPVYFIFIMAVTSFKRSQTSIFSSRLFIFLGEISYALYILQYPFFVFYTRYITLLTTGIQLACFTAGLIGFSCLMHLLVEKPMRNAIVRRFGSKGGPVVADYQNKS